MIKRFFCILLCLAAIHHAAAREISLPNKLTINIPDRFTETDFPGGFCWTDGKENLYFVCAPDTMKYDIDKCFDKYHSLVLTLNRYVGYDTKSEGIFDWNENYVERYMYHLDNRGRLVIRTAHANKIPYLLVYSYPRDGQIDEFHAAAASIRFHGSWWERLCTLFNQSGGAIIFLPIFLCCLGHLAASYIHKPKYVVTIILLILFFILGWPMLMREWDTAIVAYAYWIILFIIYLIVDISTFADITNSISKSIKK